MLRLDPLARRFLVFLGPMMLSNVVQSLSGTLNSIFLGQMIGTWALAAATAFFPVMLVLFSLLMGMAAGTSVLVGRATGAGDDERIRVVAGTSLATTLLMGVLVAVVGELFAPAIMRALGTPAVILQPATRYARVFFAAAPILFAFFLPQAVLRGTGDTKTPLRMTLVSVLVGVVVTPLLIEAGIGVVSAAVANALSIVVALVWLGWYLRRRGHALAPNWTLARRLRVDRSVVAEILHLGLPSSAQMITMSVAELVLLGLVNRFGADATAAYGAVNVLLTYLQFPAFSISITASVLAAQAIGAGRRDTLDAITRTGLGMNVVITGGLILVAYVVAAPMLSLLLTSPPVVRTATHLLDVVAWSTILFGMAGVFAGVMRASGTVLAPMALSIAAIATVEVPVATVLARVRGLDGIWFAFAATFATMFVLQAGYYCLVWRVRGRPTPAGFGAEPRPFMSE